MAWVETRRFFASPLAKSVERTFYIVRPKSRMVTGDCIGTVLCSCTALHVAVTLCQTMSDDMLQHWGVKKLMIVESTVPFAEGESISRSAAVRIFDSDGSRQ
jgi:hypothetical protein